MFTLHPTGQPNQLPDFQQLEMSKPVALEREPQNWASVSEINSRQQQTTPNTQRNKGTTANQQPEI